MVVDYVSVIIVFLISSLIGLSITKIVDSRLSDISINMPAVNLPTQEITVQIINDKHDTTEHKGKIVYNSLDSLHTGGGSATTLCKKDIPSARGTYNYVDYNSKAGPSKSSTVVPDDSKDHNSRPAAYPRDTPAMVEPIEPSDLHGTTYYIDPKDMSAAQLAKFQHKAKFEHMTIKDYENWLLTFRQTPEKLAGFHRGNLRILARGGSLVDSDMPKRTAVPPTSQQQYTEIINTPIDDNVPHPEFLGYQPSNFEDQIGASVNKNRDLRHLDYINPDEPLKTWILTRTEKPKN